MKNAGFVLLAVVVTLLSAAVAAEPVAAGVSDSKTVRCLNLHQIDQMTIVDNRNLLFETPNHTYYLNTLPRACGTLQRSSAIMYRVSQNELCNLDFITVLDPIGSGFIKGPSCALGTFKPISKVEASALLKRH